MKKLVLGLLAAALVTLGLVGAPSAQADPYPGTVAVATPAIVHSKAGKKVKIQLVTPSGNVVPMGETKTVCKAKGKKKVKKVAPVTATGAAKTGKLSKGKWTCKVTFAAKQGSIYKSGVTTTKVKVK